MPSSPSRESDLAALIAQPFAHRGLHGHGRIENSRAAFEAAIAAGRGIELDVQASVYGEPLVFHDYELDRLTEGHGRVGDLDREEAVRIKLRGSDETIPSLDEVLALIGGRVPLLIEVKSDSPAYHQLCYGIAGCLRHYRGSVGVMSFNPRVGHWFARHHPRILRGLVVSEQDKPYLKGSMERLLSLWWARPDFLAYDIRDLPSRFAGAQRAKGMKVLSWTVRTPADRARAALHADQIIYEVPSP
jgi:glycerophosphoryl diester phosphodiesterase